MFRRKKGEKDKKGDADVMPLDAPNINDLDDGMWFNPAGSVKAPSDAMPGMGIPPAAPPNGLRMSVSPRGTTRKSPSTSGGKKRSKYSVQDLIAAINYNDWSVVSQIVDQDPKVASKNAEVTLKGQKTESNALHLLVISNPPVEVVDLVLRHFPAAASNTDRQENRTALHWACIANASPAILHALAAANPSACKHKDRKFGRTPLHYLAMLAEDADQVGVLMEAERRAATMKDSDQKTPIDLVQNSSSPAKIDILDALQRRRTSSVGMFSAIKKATRGTSPGKFKQRSTSPNRTYSTDMPPPKSPGTFKTRQTSPSRSKSTDIAPKSPGKYKSRSGDAPKSPGKYKSRQSTRTKSPGKYSEKEGSKRERRHDPEKEGSSRGRRTHGRSSRTERGSTRRRGSRKDGDMEKAIQDAMLSQSDASDVDISGEFVAPPPRLTQSMSAGPTLLPRIEPPIVSSSVVQTGSRSISPVPRTDHHYHTSPSGSRSPPRPRSAGTSAMRGSAPPRFNQEAAANRSSTASSTGRSSNASRPSSQSLTVGVDGEILALRQKLERKKAALQQQDDEISQMDAQIQAGNKQKQALIRELEDPQSAGGDQQKLSEKRDKVSRLKRQIAELQAELRIAENDVQRMERGGSSGDVGQQIQSLKEEQGTLQAVMDALLQDKMLAQREVDNIESELKSLETIQLLAQDENFG